jgi:mono/diheme cytochrome c family protein
MRVKRITFLATCFLFGGMASPAQTQTADADAGEAYAEKVCAQCHAITGPGCPPNRKRRRLEMWPIRPE